MKTKIFLSFAILTCFIVLRTGLVAQGVTSGEKTERGQTVYQLRNIQVELDVAVDSLLRFDKLTSGIEWTGQFGSTPLTVETDADYGMDIMWTDWQAPKKVNCAENPVLLTKRDFRFERGEFNGTNGGGKKLNLYFQGIDYPLFLKVSYSLDPKAFYARRNIAVRDTSNTGHYVQMFVPRAGAIEGAPAIVKAGGFGQPIALRYKAGGAFLGLEYPASDNVIKKTSDGISIRCSQEIGERIGRDWLASDWVVEGVTPTTFVKQWFTRYVDDIRVAPLAPYTLYNSWYDLRSAEYPKVPEGNVMNEKNVLHIIDLMRKNMIEKHSIKLDAFVLDDGWDVYKSDWVLRPGQFPNGLKPISEELKKTGTHLGIWFGPIGGYSFRKQRVGWMKEHGYEVIGDQMCVGGKNYSSLLKKRVADYTAKEGVSYYKWDGIQFSCSDPTHGHPVGIYSRRAIMQTVIAMCDTVRAKDPATFLNISSGTWLSPWWVKYANQIWMQGEDYGYADVPSISPRDAAITYRDLSLYEDFSTNDFWFPIQNLMTHGIIKGNLERLGGRDEPLDKFTNEVLLYFARGVSMWELYISPDILSEGEWDAMGEAMHWARDRFSILSTTEMVGGDPKKRETYGYVHFQGAKGIIAARNPWIENAPLHVTLDPAYGLDPKAASLVIEQVYPIRRILPELYRAGEEVQLPLDGYETAIYEIYPLSDAKEPLVAGVAFDVTKQEGASTSLALYGSGSEARLLNPEIAEKISNHGTSIAIGDLIGKNSVQADPVTKGSSVFTPDASGMHIGFVLDNSVVSGTLSILISPDGAPAKIPPQVTVDIDGKSDTARFEKGEGSSTWYTVTVASGKHEVSITVTPRDGKIEMESARASAWLVCTQRQTAVPLEITSRQSQPPRPMPPRALPAGQRIVNVKLGECDLRK